MEKYFNDLRSKIINTNHKSGDSISLRELIDQLQKIKVLKEHFEESKETFPYHMFKNYLDNKDFINLNSLVSRIFACNFVALSSEILKPSIYLSPLILAFIILLNK